jgi:hypothetical protein
MLKGRTGPKIHIYLPLFLAPALIHSVTLHSSAFVGFCGLPTPHFLVALTCSKYPVRFAPHQPLTRPKYTVSCAGPMQDLDLLKSVSNQLLDLWRSLCSLDFVSDVEY